MANNFDPMEYKVREAQKAVVDHWEDTSVDQRVYALAGWLVDKFAPGRKRNRAKTLIVNLGIPSLGIFGVYHATLGIITAFKG